MHFSKIALLALSTTLLFSSFSVAEVRYIGDSIFIPMRSGPSNQHRIVHRGLKTGTKLTVVNSSAENGYLNVKAPSGKTGWIETQYLKSNPPAKVQLADLKLKYNKALQKNQALSSQLNQLSETQQSSESESNFLKQSNRQLSQELEEIKQISANALKLDDEVKKLRLENAELKNEHDVISTENQRLRDDKSNEAFIQGALAVIAGVIIALIVPRLWPKKKRSEWF